jgi:hypothetical protein
MKGSGIPVTGRPQIHAHVHYTLEQDQGSHPGSNEPPECVQERSAMRNMRHRRKEEQAHDRHGPKKAQFLGGDGEDKVGVADAQK